MLFSALAKFSVASNLKFLELITGVLFWSLYGTRETRKSAGMQEE